MDAPHVVRVTIEEVEELKNISQYTFYETFSDQNTPENMRKYLNEAFSTERIARELNDANTQFYFAKSENEIIGYLKINFGSSQTELKNIHALQIERIYVRSDFQGKKVGLLLYETALQIAREMRFDQVWLGVWEKNLKAITFYKKLGFAAFDKHDFRLGDDIQTDIMMKKTLL